MKLTVPDYYNEFHCIADKCRDSCCVGWGIYIDDKTAEKYRSMDGTLGRRMKSCIDFENEQCFIADEDKRCPFLNGQNLCDIILEAGEEQLCDICDRHPRFFEWFGDCIEGGIGLCCEEAARLIVSSDRFSLTELEAPKRLYEEADEYDVKYYGFLKEAREKILSLIYDESCPIDTALDRIAEYAYALQYRTDAYDIDDVPEIDPCNDTCRYTRKAAEALNSAEPPDGAPQDYFISLSAFIRESPDAESVLPQNEKPLRSIAAYFVWRYFMKGVFDGCIFRRLMTAVFCTRLINALWNRENADTDEKRADTAGLFSKSVEYSEYNLSLLEELADGMIDG